MARQEKVLEFEQEGIYRTSVLEEAAFFQYELTDESNEHILPPKRMSSRGGAIWEFTVNDALLEALRAFHSGTMVDIQRYVRILRRLRSDMLICRDAWRENCRKASIEEQQNG